MPPTPRSWATTRPSLSRTTSRVPSMWRGWTLTTSCPTSPRRAGVGSMLGSRPVGWTTKRWPHLGARPGHRAGADHRHADRPPGDQRDLRRQRRRHDRCGQAVKQAGKAGKVFVFGYDGSDQLTTMILARTTSCRARWRRIPTTWATRLSKRWCRTLTGQAAPDKGKITVVPGTYLGRSDPEAVKAWRTANGLK